MGPVRGGRNGALVRRKEAWPTRAAFVLGLGTEEGLPAARAHERAGAFLLVQRTGTSCFGPVLPEPFVLFRGQARLPFLVGFGDLEGRVLVHGSPFVQMLF